MGFVSSSSEVPFFRQAIENVSNQETIRIALDTITSLGQSQNEGETPSLIERVTSDPAFSSNSTLKHVFSLLEQKSVQQEAEYAGYSSSLEYAEVVLKKRLLSHISCTVAEPEKSLWAWCRPTSSMPPLSTENTIGTMEAPGPLSLFVAKHFEWLENMPVWSFLPDGTKKKGEVLERGWTTTQDEATPDKNWQTLMQKRKENWSKFEGFIRKNPQLELFAQGEDERYKQFSKLTAQIGRSLPILVEKKGSYLLFFDEVIPELLSGVCHTGWKSRIAQIEEEAFPQASPQGLLARGQQVAAQMRRDICEKRVLPAALQKMGCSIRDQEKMRQNVHYINAALQWGNEYLNLGLREEEMGRSEEMRWMLAPYLQDSATELMEKNYSSQKIQEELKAVFSALPEDERGSFFQEVLLIYAEGVRDKSIPPFNLQRHLACVNLYDQLKNIEGQNESSLQKLASLKTLREEFREKDFVFPLSLQSPEESLFFEIKNASFARKLMISLPLTTEKLEGYVSVLEKAKTPENSDQVELLCNKIRDFMINRTQEETQFLSKLEETMKNVCHNCDAKIAQEQIRELKKFLVSGPEDNILSDLGALVFGVAADILIPDLQKVPEISIRSWLGKIVEQPDLFGNTENVIQQLIKEPRLYLSLSQRIKDLEPVRSLVSQNPGLPYGVLAETYQSWLESPVDAIETHHKAIECKEVVLLALPNNSQIYERLNENLKNDREFVLTAIRLNPLILEFVDDRFKGDKEIFFAFINGCKLIHQDAKIEEFATIKDLALKGIQEDDDVYKYLSESLRNDKEFVLEALKKNSSLYQHLKASFKEDRDIFFTFMKAKGFLKENDLIESYPTTKDVALKAIQNDAAAYQFLRLSFKKDRDIFFTFMKAKRFLKENDLIESYPTIKDVALKAIQNNEAAYQFLGLSFKNDRDFILQAMKMNVMTFSYLKESFKEDKSFFFVFLEGCELLPKGAKIEEYATIKDLALKGIQEDEGVYEYLSQSLRNDREFILEALQRNPSLYNDLNISFKDDREVFFTFMKAKGFLKENDQIESYATTKDIALQAIQNEIQAYTCLSPTLLCDETFVLEAVRTRPLIYKYLDESLQEKVRKHFLDQGISFL